MFFNWKIFRNNKTAPILKAIYLASSAGEPMRSCSAAKAIQNRGLEGDRYYNDNGHWRLIEGCQVTLITAQELIRAQKRVSVQLTQGEHRRNLLIDGIRLLKLENRQFRIGTAVFAYDKPRPPCGYIDRIAETGMCKALAYNSGICIKVIESGTLTVGDPVEILT